MEIELRINKNYTIQRSLRKQIIINSKQTMQRKFTQITEPFFQLNTIS